MAGKNFQGIVVKRSGNQTVAVAVRSVRIHPLYHKRMQRTRRLLAHDPSNTAVVGQKVTLRQSRPRSRHKHWVIVG